MMNTGGIANAHMHNGGRSQPVQVIRSSIGAILVLTSCIYSVLKQMPEKGNYAWFSPLGAEQPWQGDSFLGCGIFC